MAYAFVNQATGVSTGNPTSLATSSITPVAGNHLFAVLQVLAAATGVSISDTVNTYVLLGSFNGNSSTFTYYVYEANNVAATAITPTGSVSTSSIRGIYVRQDSGLANPAYVTGSFTSAKAPAPGTGSNSITTGNVNVNTAPSALIGFCVDESGNTHSSMTPGTGFTGRGDLWTGGNTPCICEDQRITIASSVPITFNPQSTGGSDNYIVTGGLFAETGAIVGQAIPPGGPSRVQWHYRSA